MRRENPRLPVEQQKEHTRNRNHRRPNGHKVGRAGEEKDLTIINDYIIAVINLIRGIISKTTKNVIPLTPTGEHQIICAPDPQGLVVNEKADSLAKQIIDRG